jgi:hypothetical protein
MATDDPTKHGGLSYGKILVDVACVSVTLIALAALGLRRPTTQPGGESALAPAPKAVAAAPPVAEPEPTLEPVPVPRPLIIAPTLDREVVARAEAELATARRVRIQANDLLDAEKAKLARAEIDAAAALSQMRSFLARVKDPSGRISGAKARGGLLREEQKHLENEITKLAASPRPGRKRLVDKSPVARPPDGEEFHFELHRGRISFIDLNRLMERVKADARTQVRFAPVGRAITGEVGPAGAFSMRYVIGFDRSDSFSEYVPSRGGSLPHLQGWRLIAVSERRGESYEVTRHPASEYARAVNRLNPGRDAITMWVYPDSFPLYRRLRDELNSQGFLVAGRPLPDGVPIQGSPGGSKSAGQ